jgi:Putative zinc-finger
MSELNEMNCHEFQDAAAELALGVLTGRERAQAMAHLEYCEACRENVRQLTLTGEGLLGLLPAMEPPVGFETRVMDRIGLAAPAPGPGRRLTWLPPFGRRGASQGGSDQPG